MEGPQNARKDRRHLRKFLAGGGVLAGALAAEWRLGILGLDGRLAAFFVLSLAAVGVIGAWLVRTVTWILEVRRAEERRSAAPQEVLDALEELQIRLTAISERLARLERRPPDEADEREEN